ncbi:hypothetical protein [Aliiruegeria sabulilitoris]|uniref:hypothetical protein n=1 Tax=Aliiruegeria sabulilitoris TaxID=1510458 RepID=UPI0012E37702|nr:hypothetical protein [Aliiruegeria sabulilitoris]
MKLTPLEIDSVVLALVACSFEPEPIYVPPTYGEAGAVCCMTVRKLAVLEVS